ncbi:amidase [Acuticoccus sp. MNP-M23]|uniref:amidase n=1 Tax=Acuticoccus sp. MNP-M23 TaxID=3072793 RepID=UPI0028164029|nr:amidase [Acuticoccus sp. MNP-M23]WMS44530.1 amidase [Acuticoccus sp. MNP-M23]
MPLAPDVRWDCRTLVTAIHEGRTDPGAGVARALDAIAAHNGVLNAVVDHDPELAEPQLDRLRARLARGERPPLSGLPVTVKDHIHVAGWKATGGSLLLADNRPERDDPAVARLRDAGAILIGRTNMSEFGCKGVTSNRIYGATGHPADPLLTPGGSSGGAAAAVAAGMCAFALASDGGGSIRRPAAHVGVIGFKPSAGAIPGGHILSHTNVLGVLAAEVDTAMLVFAALRGADRADPVSVNFPADRRSLEGTRIGWAPTLGLDVRLDEAVAAAAERARARLSAAGVALEPAAPEWPSGADEPALMPLQHAALATRWGEAWRTDPTVFDTDIASQIEAGLRLDGTAVARADAMSREIARAAATFFATGPDLLVSLTTPCPAWPHALLAPPTIGGLPAGPRDHAALTPLVNHAFLPAVSIPCGETERGLPLGLQIIGPRFADDFVLRAAATFLPLLGAS